MAGGLVGLFDDVAALAKLAAASVDDVALAAGRASMKAAANAAHGFALRCRHSSIALAASRSPSLPRLPQRDSGARVRQGPAVPSSSPIAVDELAFSR